MPDAKEPYTFDDAVADTMKAYKLTHSQALSQIQQWYDAHDPDTRAIPNIGGRLWAAQLHGGAAAFFERAEQPYFGMAHKLSGLAEAEAPDTGRVHEALDWLQKASDPEARHQRIGAEEMQSGYSDVGGIAGDVAGMWGLGKMAAPIMRGIPYIGKLAAAASDPKASLYSRIPISAAEMWGLQQAGAFPGMGPKGALATGALAPVFGKAVEGITGAAGRLPEAIRAAAGSVFGRGEAETMAAMPSAADFEAAGLRPTPPPPPVAPPSAIVGKPSPLNEIRDGQPFDSKTLVPARTGIPGVYKYSDPQSVTHGPGPAGEATWRNILQVSAPNSIEDGWVSAAKQLHSGNPNILDSIDAAQDKEGYSMALAARRAKGAGYDAIHLKTPDPREGVVLDLRDVKGPKDIAHPEIGKGTYTFAKAKPKGMDVGMPTKSAGPPSRAVQKEMSLRGLERALGRKFNAAEARAFEKVWADKGPFDPSQPLASRVEAGAAMNPTRPDIGAPKAHGEGNISALDKDLVEIAKGDAVNPAGDTDTEMITRKQGLLTGNLGTMNAGVGRAVRVIRDVGDFVKAFHSQWGSDTFWWRNMIGRTVEQQAKGNVWMRMMKERWTGAMKKYPAFRDPKMFDELARAVKGLEPDANGVYHQTMLNVAPEIDAAAREFAWFRDRGNEFLFGNDFRVPFVLEQGDITLSHTRRNLERIRDLQRLLEDPTGNAQAILDATSDQEGAAFLRAAERTKGMLNFDATHDLDADPRTGWLDFHPVRNERAMVIDTINHFKKLGDIQKRPFEEQVYFEQLLDRLDELDKKAWDEVMSRGPTTDFAPKHKWIPLLHAKQPLFHSTDPNEVFGQFAWQIVNKRTADVALYHGRTLMNSAEVIGTVKDRAVDWMNGVRGAIGFKADRKTAMALNAMLRDIGVKDFEISAKEVHEFGSTMLDWFNTTRLHLSQVRYPIINMTHLFATVMPVAGGKYFNIGMQRTLSSFQKSFQEALEAGVISDELETAKEIGKIESGSWSRPLKATAYLSEKFRKVATFQVGKAMAEGGEFSELIRGYTGKGFKNDEERVLDYARQFTSELAFDLSPVKKPLWFQGGTVMRGLTQMKSWQSGLIGLYYNMARLGHWKEFGLGMVALGTLGGLRAMSPIPGTYDFVRHELLRKGINLPNRPLYHYALSALGMQDSAPDQVEIYSLTDPFGLDPYNVQSLLGPIPGAVIGTTQNVLQDIYDGKQYKWPQEVVGAALGPQVQAMIDAVKEGIDGGVRGPKGEWITQGRPLQTLVARGLDLQPSARVLSHRIEMDLDNALLSNDPRVVRSVMDEAAMRGIVVNKPMERRARAFLRAHARAAVHPLEW